MSVHQGMTDAVHKVTLTSSIDVALWLVQSAGIGEKAPFAVYTHHVGDGAEASVEVRTKSGKTLGTVPGKVGLNRVSGSFLVPQGTTEDLYFEVKLSKHGLTARSGLLKVVPARALSNARWGQKEARHGDVVNLLADAKQVVDGTDVTVTVLERDIDGVIDKVATIPTTVRSGKIDVKWEFGYYDDTAEIPPHERASKGYYAPRYLFRAAMGAVEVESGLLEYKDFVEVRFRSRWGILTDIDYILHMADGTQRKGRVGQEGFVIEKDVPPGPVRVEITGS